MRQESCLCIIIRGEKKKSDGGHIKQKCFRVNYADGIWRSLERLIIHRWLSETFSSCDIFGNIKKKQSLSRLSTKNNFLKEFD